MNSVLAIVAYLAALNPARTRLGVPQSGTTRADMARLGVGTAVGVAALLGLAAASGRLLDALQISPETYRIAAGFVLVIVAAWMLFVPVPPDEPAPPGQARHIWPVAFPRVVSPETLALALTTGASDGLGVTTAGLLVAGLALVALGPISTAGLGGRLMGSLGRVTSLFLVVVAIWLAIQGVREV